MITAAPPRPRASPVLGSALDLRKSQIPLYAGRHCASTGTSCGWSSDRPACGSICTACSNPDGVRAVPAGWELLTCEGELLGAPTLVIEKALHEAADDDGHREAMIRAP